jgi:sugar phosphate isomerase/epimerase
MHATEVGRGTIDWLELFAAARASGVESGFVEQDLSTAPRSFESAKANFDFLRDLRY